MKRIIIFIILFLIVLSYCYAINEQNLNKVKILLQDFHQKHSFIPGFSVIIVEKDKVIYSRGFGTLHIESEKPFTVHTPVAIGSFAKSFTAMAIMQLVEQDKINLDTPVITYLPWWRTADKHVSDTITVRMLLSNSSGLPSVDHCWFNDDQTDEALKRGVQTLSAIKTVRTPGESFEYSNEGWNILGLIIEKVSRLPYRLYIREKILKPLTMHKSTTDITLLSRLYGEDYKNGHNFGIREAFKAKDKLSVSAMPAGTIFRSTSSDIAHYLIALLNGGYYKNTRIVKKSSIDLMWTPHINIPAHPVELGGSGKDDHYGFGWGIYKIDGITYICHGGDTRANSSMNILDLKNKLACSLFLNTSSVYDKFRFTHINNLALNIMRLLTGREKSKYYIPVIKDPNLKQPFITLPYETKKKYEGLYISNKGQYCRISLGNDGLVIAETDMLFYKNISQVNFINPSLMVFRSLAGTYKAKAHLTKNGYVKDISLLGNIFRKKLNYKRNNYQTYFSPGKILSFHLPEDWEISWENESFHAYSKNKTIHLRGYFVSVSLFKHIDLVNEGEKILFTGELFKESRNTYEFEMKSLTYHNGAFERQRIILLARCNGKNLLIKMDSPFGELATAIYKVLNPCLDSLNFAFSDR